MRSRTVWVLTGVVLVLSGVAVYFGGPSLTLAGWTRGLWMLIRVAPLLVAAFTVAGLLPVLVSSEVITRWLGAGAGLRGITLACLAGTLVPGGPYVYYPMAAALLRSGASLGSVVGFVTAKNLWSLTRLPVEFALLGPQLTLVRLLVTLPFPLLMGVLAQWLWGSHIERIRGAMQCLSQR